MKNILLTGASGFIGKFLYNTLKNDYSIIPLGNNNGSFDSHIYNINLTNKPDLESFIDKIPKCEALIFLVGLAHKKGKRKDLLQFRNVNKETLVNLLSVLKQRNKLPDKIIFSSTISVYGENFKQTIYNENSHTKPFSPYAVTKLEAEKYLLNKFFDHSWIIRLAPVYASNFNLNINRRVKTGGWFFKVGNGSKKLSLCNLENIGKVVHSILENKVPADVYNLSDETEYSYNDLLNFMDAKLVIPIPQNLVKALYLIGAFMNNTFLKENAIKLVTDNIFPSKKIRKYISINASLN